MWLNPTETLNVGFSLLLNVENTFYSLTKFIVPIITIERHCLFYTTIFTSELYNYFSNEFTNFNQLNSGKTVKYYNKIQWVWEVLSLSGKYPDI